MEKCFNIPESPNFKSGHHQHPTKLAVNAIILVSSTTQPQLLIEQGGRKLGEINVLLDSGADISLMNDTLASRIGFQRSEEMDISRSQKTTATNQVMEISGEGIATKVLDEDTRITTTIFTSQDIVHDLLVLSNEVMRKMGILWNQDSVTPGHPHQLDVLPDMEEDQSCNSTGSADIGNSPGKKGD